MRCLPNQVEFSKFANYLFNYTMKDFNFSKWNTILGWFAFAVALITFTLTVEPTASFWDAGEYIATASKLEIGHPPGAPLYQMLGAVFSVFALESSQIALMVNMMSVLASAFTILFMFWSISILIRKISGKAETLSAGQKTAVLGSALVGSLAFTFTDSFWFNAVEAEVYAMATFILSVIFYVGLLWERDMLKPRGNRWLILICFIVGLLFGVHFMGLLAIPAIGYLYFFKNYKEVTAKNFIIATVIIVAILMFIFKLLLPYSLSFFAISEVFFVNTIGLPFNSGTIIALLVVIAGFYFGITYTRKKRFVHVNTLLLCVLFILIGFSSWTMLPIRANAGTVINENNPANARELLAYYNREQYGESHLFYGPQFTEMYSGLDENNPYSDAKPKYEQDEKTGKYVIVNDWENANQNLDDNHKGFLPRMWSPEHKANYLGFIGELEFTVKPEYRDQQELLNAVADVKTKYALGQIDAEDYDQFLTQFGQYLDIEKPSFASNIGYMIEYQFGYMYWRYFMWNFTGRQDDVQGKMDDLHGNWLSGIKFIDELRLGSQDNLPSDVKNNKARNTYFFLPFLLGLLGLVFQFTKDKKNFWVLLVFFLFTGLALKVYLNERPFEVRERDYALVGSFYVFAMWIGFGVYALYDMLKDKITTKMLAPAVTVVCLLAVPVVLASQNWDDHDRSDRYTAQSMAKMYLDSCDENAILFTIGDNDTFALWYAQEIEGYRRDVRVVNTALFATDWYIDQMRRKAYESDRIPTTLEHKNYVYGVNDAVWYQKDPRVRDTLLIKDWIKYIKSDNETTKAELRSGQIVNTFPTKNLRLPVSGSNAIEHGIVKEKDREKIAPYIDITLKGDIIYKNRLIMLDVIANNEWKRPIYFTGGSYGDDDYLWMKDYLQLDGMCYKLVPIRTPIDKRNPYDMGRIDTDKMYNIVKEWDWGNGNDPDIYHDPETRKNGLVYRSNLAKLIEELIKEKDFERAEEMLDLGMEQMPVDYYGFYTLLEPFISGYYEIGKPKKARDIWRQVATKYQENLTYYSGFKESRQFRYAEDIITDIERYRSLVDILIIYQDEELVKPEAEKFNNYLRLFRHFYGEDEEMNPEEELTPEEQQYIEGFEKEFGTETTPKIDSVNNLDSIN
mgnify:CR=1 FL=1